MKNLKLIFDSRGSKNDVISKSGIVKAYFRSSLGKEKKAEIVKFEKTLGFEMPAIFKGIYSKFTSLNIRWTYQKNHIGLIEGRCWFHGPYSFNRGYFNARRSRKKGEKLKEFLWAQEDDTEWITLIEEKYFIIDFIDFNANTFVLLSFNDQQPELTLFMYPNFLYPLNITIEEYLYWVDKTYAMQTWMEYFIDKEKCTSEALEHLSTLRSGRFFANMDLIFPEQDLTDFPGKPEKEASYSFIDVAAEKDYFNSLEKLSSKFPSSPTGLQPTPEIHVRRLNIHVVRKIETILGRKLPDSMLAFYSQVNGFRMNWKYEENSEFGSQFKAEDEKNYTYGEFDLYSLDKVFGGRNHFENFHWARYSWPGSVSDPENMNEEQLLFAKDCHLIYGSEFNNVVMRFEEGKEEPDLYLCEYKLDKFFHKLTLTFSEFIDKLFENMGLQYWPYFFIEDDEYAEEMLKGKPNVPNILAKLNPEADLSGYRTK